MLTPDGQEIPNGWAIPPGAETKTDRAEGLDYARLAPIAPDVRTYAEPVDDIEAELDRRIAEALKGGSL